MLVTKPAALRSATGGAFRFAICSLLHSRGYLFSFERPSKCFQLNLVLSYAACCYNFLRYAGNRDALFFSTIALRLRHINNFSPIHKIQIFTAFEWIFMKIVIDLILQIFD